MFLLNFATAKLRLISVDYFNQIHNIIMSKWKGIYRKNSQVGDVYFSEKNKHDGFCYSYRECDEV